MQVVSRFTSLSGLPRPQAGAFSAPGLVPLFRGFFIPAPEYDQALIGFRSQLSSSVRAPSTPSALLLENSMTSVEAIAA